MDLGYLDRVRGLAAELEAAWVSDHLCFTSHGGHHFHDLLPLPWTEEALDQVSARVERVQETLGAAILVENVSSYLRYRHSTLREGEFLCELARRTGCGILLDANNLYVSQVNHGVDPRAYMDSLPPAAVRQMHLAGHADHADYLVDAHHDRVADPVWTLFDEACCRFPGVPALIEWDNDIPGLDILLDEAARADAVQGRCRRAGNVARAGDQGADAGHRSPSGAGAPRTGNALGRPRRTWSGDRTRGLPQQFPRRPDRCPAGGFRCL